MNEITANQEQAQAQAQAPTRAQGPGETQGHPWRWELAFLGSAALALMYPLAGGVGYLWNELLYLLALALAYMTQGVVQ